MSRCYWEENGIEEQQQGSEGEDGGPEVGALSLEGATTVDGKRDKLCTPLHLWPSTDDHWRLQLSDDSIPGTKASMIQLKHGFCICTCFFFFFRF